MKQQTLQHGFTTGHHLEHRSSNRSESRYGQTPSPSMGEGQ
jgi:hypothetical protein